MEPQLFAGKYIVVEECKEEGGMGKVLFVRAAADGPLLALKFCKETHEQLLHRFQREVTILKQYEGNTKVVQVIDSDLSHNPPYFVMPYADGGNLLSLKDRLMDGPSNQENVFNRMIDCVAELHNNDHIHRDIKPQNFLIDKTGEIVVADFGLVKDFGSSSSLTATQAQGGTEEYAPPEHFHVGGFKTAEMTWDVFTLGKSFYRLITNKNARYLSETGVEPVLFYVIEKCCRAKPEERYQSLAELKQALKTAFDLILGRYDGEERYQALLSSIEEKLKREQRYSPGKVVELLETLHGLDEKTRARYIKKMDANLIAILAGDSLFAAELSKFIELYRKVTESKDYAPEFAEKIAHRMEVIFNSDASQESKAAALEIAVRAAVLRGRFAAMAICVSMIIGTTGDQLAAAVAEVLTRNPEDFILNIEPSSCKHQQVAQTVQQLRRARKKRV